jgi:chaperone modulatory protein CbpM
MDERSTIPSSPSAPPKTARTQTGRTRTYALATVRPGGLTLESFSRASGLHPDLARRLVSLGLLDARADATGELRFPPAQLAVAARIQRLRAGFSLNYAAIGLVMDLLDRIARLETVERTTAVRRRPTRNGGSS